MTQTGPAAARINRTLERAARLLSLALGLALIAAVFINVANVIGRYGLNQPIEGADEVQIYLMVALAFLGAVVAHIRHGHLRMDVLARRFPPAAARAANIAEALVGIGVCGLMTWISFSYVSRIWRLGSHSENAHIPMWIPHGILVVAFALMTAVGVVRLFVAAPRPPVRPPVHPPVRHRAEAADLAP